MQFINIKNIILTALLLVAVGLSTVSAAPFVSITDDLQPPVVPCTEVQVQDGNKVSFHVYAIGVQIYRWNGASWVFVAPVANLYSDAGYHGQVGTHYAGPTWESNSGSKVVASRVDGCTPDPTAIPWLLLKTVSTDGPGIFKKVTFIQRVNTTGGLPPTSAGVNIGEEKRVPYTAEYYFYRAQ
jgi:hypothetical protein